MSDPSAPAAHPGAARRGRQLRYSLLIAILGVGLVLRLINAWTELEDLSQTTLPDDAFYYFGIARHLMLGHPPSVDGFSPTNGYHPLWLLCLLPIYGVLGTGAEQLRSAVHAALTLGVVFDLLAAVLLFRLTTALRFQWSTRLLVLGWYCLAPYRVLQATNGMETSLSVACLLGLLLLSVRLCSGRSRLGRANAIKLGLLAGATVLARTDLAFVVIALGVAGLWAARGVGREVRQRQWRGLAVAAGTAALLITPWLVYSFVTVGTIVQSSGVALSVVAHRMPEVWGLESVPTGLALARRWASLLEAWHAIARYLGPGTWGATVLGAVALTGGWLSRGRSRQLLAGQLRRLLPFAAGMTALLAAHAEVRFVFREWYTAPYAVLLALLTACGLDSLLRSRRPARVAVVGLALLGVGSFVGEWKDWQRDGLYGRAGYAHIRPSTQLHEGHSDCGAVSYFTTQGITNLDGVVNQAALEALSSGRLLEYLRQHDFERVYMTDHYHSSVFFGAGYRDHLRNHPTDRRAVRLVRNAAEKDRLIRLDQGSFSLGGWAGREHLGDGWIWETHPRAAGWVQSIGFESELLFSLDRPPAEDAVLVLELAARATNEDGVQPVSVWLNRTRVADLEVTQEGGHHRLPLAAAQVGRNRLHLAYGAAQARPLGDQQGRTWWRALRGSPVLAVAANAFTLEEGSAVALPPVGPDLGDPRSDRLFRQGWQVVDRAAVPPAIWASAQRASIEFRVKDPRRWRALLLAVGPPPPTGDNRDQSVQIFLNARLVGELAVEQGTIRSHRVALPSGALKKGKNVLSFEFARLGKDPANGASLAAYFQRVALQRR